MRSLALSIALSLLVCWPAHAEEAWKVFDMTDEGYELATREEPGREIPSLRARGELKGDVVHLLAILLDAPRSTEWAEGADEVKILKRTGPLTALVYSYSNLAWPVSDRDVIMDAQLKVIRRGEEYILEMRCCPDTTPRRDGVIRITEAHVHFHIKQRPGGKVWIEYEINADPGGSLPKWLIRWATRKVPRVTLQKLEKQLEKTQGDYAATKAEILSHG